MAGEWRADGRKGPETLLLVGPRTLPRCTPMGFEPCRHLERSLTTVSRAGSRWLEPEFTSSIGSVVGSLAAVGRSGVARGVAETDRPAAVLRPTPGVLRSNPALAGQGIEHRFPKPRWASERTGSRTSRNVPPPGELPVAALGRVAPSRRVVERLSHCDWGQVGAAASTGGHRGPTSYPVGTLPDVDVVLIFDGDDTLWSTEELYDDARQRVRQIVDDHGLDGAQWEIVERVKDVENVAVFGMSATRFPTSCIQALDEVAAGTPAAALRSSVWDAAMTVFTAAAPSMPGARETLRVLSRRHTIVLLTKGDPEIQTKRVATSGLAEFLTRVEIVDEKTPATFRKISSELGSDPVNAVSIGNSLASDICPAVDVGMGGIWIDAHVWEYERSRSARAELPDGTVAAESIIDVPGIVEELYACH